jgi:hypothetical protein
MGTDGRKGRGVTGDDVPPAMKPGPGGRRVGSGPGGQRRARRGLLCYRVPRWSSGSRGHLCAAQAVHREVHAAALRVPWAFPCLRQPPRGAASRRPGRERPAPRNLPPGREILAGCGSQRPQRGYHHGVYARLIVGLLQHGGLSLDEGPAVGAEAAAGLAFLGVVIDPARNDVAYADAEITAPGAAGAHPGRDSPGGRRDGPAGAQRPAPGNNVSRIALHVARAGQEDVGLGRRRRRWMPSASRPGAGEPERPARDLRSPVRHSAGGHSERHQLTGH